LYSLYIDDKFYTFVYCDRMNEPFLKQNVIMKLNNSKSINQLSSI